MSEKILVVDDEPLILIAVERALSKVGYHITKAGNMRELDLALGASPFDLLITDVFIQDATLEEVIEKVRELSPMVKIIKMSGSINADGSELFIGKPFNIEALRKCVKKVLDESR